MLALRVRGIGGAEARGFRSNPKMGSLPGNMGERRIWLEASSCEFSGANWDACAMTPTLSFDRTTGFCLVAAQLMSR